jgi:hypothetical protein
MTEAIPTVQLIHNDCPNCLTILDQLGSYYLDIERRKKRDDAIPNFILNQLSANDFSLTIALINRFGGREVAETDQKTTIITVPIATLRIPIAPQATEFGDILVNAQFTLKEMAGMRSIEGSFVAEY